MLYGLPSMKCSASTVLALSIAIGTGVFSEAATASDGRPPTNVPAIAQYIESQPTLAGPSVTPSSGTASPKVAREIAHSGGKDQAALIKLSDSTPNVSSAAIRRAVSTPGSKAIGPVVGGSGISYTNAILVGAILVMISAFCGAAAVRRKQSSPVGP